MRFWQDFDRPNDLLLGKVPEPPGSVNTFLTIAQLNITNIVRIL